MLKIDRDYIDSFIGKKIHCKLDYLIKDCIVGNIHGDVILKRNEYFYLLDTTYIIDFSEEYELKSVLFLVDLVDYENKTTSISISKKDFFNHFQLKTLADIRREKIEKLLDDKDSPI